MDAQIKQCRICMDNSLQFLSMDSCSTDYPFRTLRENFNFCTHLDAQKDDKLPDAICKACFKDLNSAVEFVQRAREADIRLRELLAPSSEPSAPMSSSTDMIEVKQEECVQFEMIEAEQSSDYEPGAEFDECSDGGIAETSNPINVGDIECSPSEEKQQPMLDEKDKRLTIIICSICGESCSECGFKSHVAKHQVAEKASIKFYQCKNGQKKLVVEGYVLHQNRVKKDICYWECKLRRKNLGGCNSRATTKFINENHQLQTHTAHNHAPLRRDVEKLERLKFKTISKKNKCTTKSNKIPCDEEDQRTNAQDTSVWHFGSGKELILYDPTQPVHPRMPKKDFLCYLCGESLPNSHSFKSHVTRHTIDMQLASTEPCKLIQSQKGSPLLAYQGYIFHKNRSTNDLCYWQCKLSRDRLGGCKSRITTHIVNGQHHLKTHTPHNHLPKDKEVEKVEAMAEIKKIAKTTQEPTMQILDEVQTQLGYETNPEMPSVELIRKIVKRARQSEQALSLNTIKSEPSDMNSKFDGNAFLPQQQQQQLQSQEHPQQQDSPEVEQKCDLEQLIVQQQQQQQEPYQEIEELDTHFVSNTVTVVHG